MEIIFIATLGIVLLNLLTILSMLGKHTLSLPSYKWLDPTQWWLFYPSFFYQVYWWSMYMNLIQ